MKKEHRPNRVLMAAGILLSLCMISAHFTTGLYARYTTRASAGDAATVAGLSIVLDSAVGPTTLEADMKGDYVITVSNASEVAVCCSELKLDFEKTKVVSAEVKSVAVAPKQEGDDPTVIAGTDEIVTVGENAITISKTKGYNMKPGDSLIITVEVKLDPASAMENSQLAINPDYSTTYQNDDMSQAAGKVTFSVRTTFTQID